MCFAGIFNTAYLTGERETNGKFCPLGKSQNGLSSY